jgi:predicted RNase H-like HicB family nuclease
MNRSIRGGFYAKGACYAFDMRKTFTAVIERDVDTGLYIAFVPGLAGAHTQAETLDELQANLKEVLEMLLEDGELSPQVEFVGTQLVEVGCARSSTISA